MCRSVFPRHQLWIFYCIFTIDTPRYVAAMTTIFRILSNFLVSYLLSMIISFAMLHEAGILRLPIFPERSWRVHFPIFQPGQSSIRRWVKKQESWKEKKRPQMLHLIIFNSLKAISIPSSGLHYSCRKFSTANIVSLSQGWLWCYARIKKNNNTSCHSALFSWTRVLRVCPSICLHL